MIDYFSTPYNIELPSLTDVTYVSASSGRWYAYIPFSASSFSAEDTTANVTTGTQSWCSVRYVQKYGLDDNIWLLVVAIKAYDVFDQMQSLSRETTISGTFCTSNDKVKQPFSILLKQIGCEATLTRGDIVLWNRIGTPNTDYFVKTESWSGKKMSANEILTFDVAESKMISTMCNNLSEAYANQRYLTGFSAQTCDFSNVASFSNMFTNCSSLESIDMSDWDMSNTTSISGMFSGCTAISSITFPNYSNTSKCTNMSSLFSGCANLERLNIGTIETNLVTDMSNMFNGCSKLRNFNYYGLNTSKVKYMDNMFANCSLLTTLDLRGWDFSKAQYNGIFAHCEHLTSIIGGRSGSSNGATAFNGAKENIDISQTQLDRESIIAIFRGVATLNSWGKKRIKMTDLQYNMVRANISIATQKGWMIEAPWVNSIFIRNDNSDTLMI